MGSRRKLEDVAVGRDNNFNLLRVIAASGVILSHAYPLGLGPDTPEPLETILKGDNLGRLCVFIFFATSGFFITASFDRRRSFADYFWGRVLRIYPGLIVMLCLMLPLVGLIDGQGAAFWARVPYIIFNETAMFLKLDQGPRDYVLFATNPLPNAFNGSLWTLRFEVLCYVGVVIGGYLGVLRNRWAALAALALAIAGYYAVPAVTSNFLLRVLSYVGLPFAFGAAAYVWRAHLVMDGLLLLGLLAASAALQPTPLFFPMMIATVTYGVLWFGHLELPWLQHYNRVGDYSYGIYIYAFPIQQIVAHVGITSPLPQAAISLLLTLICAIASWHLVEQPALRLRKRLAAGSRRKMPGPGVSSG